MIEGLTAHDLVSCVVMVKFVLRIIPPISIDTLLPRIIVIVHAQLVSGPARIQKCVGNNTYTSLCIFKYYNY